MKQIELRVDFIFEEQEFKTLLKVWDRGTIRDILREGGYGELSQLVATYEGTLFKYKDKK